SRKVPIMRIWLDEGGIHRAPCNEREAIGQGWNIGRNVYGLAQLRRQLVQHRFGPGDLRHAAGMPHRNGSAIQESSSSGSSSEYFTQRWAIQHAGNRSPLFHDRDAD